MSQNHFKSVTFARYNGHTIVLGALLENGERRARWFGSHSYFNVKASEVTEF